MVDEDELGRLKRFRAFLRSEDKEVFDDLMNQCSLYASYTNFHDFTCERNPADNVNALRTTQETDGNGKGTQRSKP